MQAIFYDAKKGAWFDYNLRNGQLNTEFYGSIAVPLFTKCYQPLNLGKSSQIVEFMNVNILNQKFCKMNERFYIY